ncbi:MAG: hypothetical protein AAF665_03260 [Pseudomonadota bacterium]
MIDFGRRYHVGITSVLRRCAAVGVFKVILPISALLTGCTTTAETVDLGSLSSERGLRDFKSAALERCLPAALTDTQENTAGLKELTREQIHLLIGETNVPAFVFGENAILVDVGRGACQVGAFVAYHEKLSLFPDEWLIADGAPFKEAKKPNQNTRFFLEPGGATVSFSQYPNLTLLRAVSGARLARSAASE